MSDARNVLSADASHIWSLRIGILLLALLQAASLAVIYYLNTQIDVHVPPDISKGATLKHGQLQKPNAYSFALTVWKGINSWVESGNKEYGGNIEKYSCQLTPRFKAELTKHLKTKVRRGELDRSRDLYEKLAYEPEFVSDIGSNTLTVALLMQLKERVKDMPVKDTNIHYSLRVIPDFRACNDYKMALDGFTNDPYRQEADAK